jgi:hypothetical protein
MPRMKTRTFQSGIDVQCLNVCRIPLSCSMLLPQFQVTSASTGMARHSGTWLGSWRGSGELGMALCKRSIGLGGADVARAPRGVRITVTGPRLCADVAFISKPGSPRSGSQSAVAVIPPLPAAVLLQGSSHRDLTLTSSSLWKRGLSLIRDAPTISPCGPRMGGAECLAPVSIVAIRPIVPLACGSASARCVHGS